MLYLVSLANTIFAYGECFALAAVQAVQAVQVSFYFAPKGAVSLIAIHWQFDVFALSSSCSKIFFFLYRPDISSRVSANSTSPSLTKIMLQWRWNFSREKTYLFIGISTKRLSKVEDEILCEDGTLNAKDWIMANHLVLWSRKS